MERHPEHRAAHVEVRDRLPRLGVPVEIPPHGHDITPAVRIADPGDTLPCQARLPGADVEIKRHEPLAVVPERVATLDADDPVPEGLADRLASAAARDNDWSEVAGDREPER